MNPTIYVGSVLDEGVDRPILIPIPINDTGSVADQPYIVYNYAEEAFEIIGEWQPENTAREKIVSRSLHEPSWV